jgi:GNAT superfamily N-acetyltransferase
VQAGPGVVVRPATKQDGPALGRMGAALARLHHRFDRKRFMLPADVEAGYRWWLLRELKNPQAVVLVAQVEGRPVGYAYGRAEPRDWNALREACGAFHDLWVDKPQRALGVGALLSESMMTRLTLLGCPRVVLTTASQNRPAQSLFTRLGWRPTMIEFTREASRPRAARP